MNYIIDRAKPSDAEEILEFLKQAGGESDNLTFGAEGLPYSVEQEEKMLEGNETSTTTVFLIARVDGKIIGDASFIMTDRERLKHQGELGVTVLKEYWGNGIGKALVEAILDFAKNVATVQFVYLNVRSDNFRAIKLYEKLGFKKSGTIPGFMKINGEYIDCDFMYMKF